MWLFLCTHLSAISAAAAFVSQSSPRFWQSTTTTNGFGSQTANEIASRVALLSKSSDDKDDDNDDAWDADVDYDKVFPEDPNQNKSPDPTLGWEVNMEAVPTPKLGIDIGALLEPLSEKEAAELKAAATEVINEAVAAGIDEIETVRAKMKKELELQRRQMQRESERNMEQASASLLSRIDSITDAFLANTTLSRTSTKLAAQADRQMEGRGIDVGTWGTIGGATVAAGSTSLGTSGFGGVSMASDSAAASPAAVQQQENRILIIADTKQDEYAKKLIGPLTKELEQVLTGVAVETMKPTATLPLGGNNAAAVVVFLTSLTDVSSVKRGLERLTRQTMSASGQLAQPPTQIIAISTVGTARTNQMPYSMQNLFSGQLGKRKQMEEAVQSFVENGEKARDFTIVKLGELKDQAKEDFALAPGDVLDGATDVASAVGVLKQAIALQSPARNATVCSVGDSSASDITQEVWDDLFLQLDGPEIWRLDLDDNEASFDQLVEYMMEWSELPATSKGLTTPIRLEQSVPVRPMGVSRQRAIQFLYLPTATGDRYMSKDEERAREREMNSGGAKSTTTTKATPSRAKPTKEGGLEILLEVTETPKAGTRIRVRRCNYAPGVVIKELTEESLLSRIKKSIDVWKTL